uniref:Uncharacterized protein n=1 Tax=viral metagenome TaxID=1070528 RepID=A0A6C0H1C9_9ZZZZ
MSKNKIELYTQYDIDVIGDNIDILMKEADKIKQTEYEPTITEFNNVVKDVEIFIKKKNRIVYGGTALNRLIASKNPKDAFYKEYDRPDIEFYSPEPLQDVKELCDYLYSKNYKYVSSAQAQHGDTYKIFVNEMDIGDISYVPAFIYNKLPYIELNGLKYIKPQYAFIDYLRMYTDPLMSFWRLQKAIPRGMLLLKNFPLEIGNGKIKYDSLDEKESIILKDISSLIEKSNSIIHVGTYAVKFYTIDKKSERLPYEVISVEYEKDVKKIYEELNKKHKITIREYFPYFQFWDRHIEFIFNNKVVLTIFNNLEKCIPYRKYDYGFIASFQVVLLHHLVKYYYYVNNKLNYENVNNILGEILRSRNEYLKKNNKTVMDDTIYREFQINCLGKALDPMRYAFIEFQKKLSEGKRTKYRYNPKTDYDLKLPEFIFDNTSGNLIKNNRLMTVKSENSETVSSESSDVQSKNNRISSYTLEDSDIDSSQEETKHSTLLESKYRKKRHFGFSESSEKTLYTSEFI